MEYHLSLARLLPKGSIRRQETKRFVKFAFVGALGAVTDFTILIALVEFASLLPVVAGGFGFTAAVLQNFFLNRLWTFPESRIHNTRRQIAKFAIVSIVGLGINLIGIGLLDQSLRPFWIDFVSSPDLGFRISYIFAKLVSVGIVLFWNFAANRLWTFKGL